MPLIAFVDEEVEKSLSKINKNSKNNKEEKFPEHSFVASCLRSGLQLSDLEKITYIDVMKILLSFIDDNDLEQRCATQSDIDRLLG